MRLINILILIFLLSAFAIGSSLESVEQEVIEKSLDNVSMIMQNITLESSDNQYTDGMFTILEKFVNFIGVTFVEVMRLGMSFGSNNSEYFEPDFILKIIRLIIWLTIISLLIQPLFYFIVLILMLSLWIVDKIKKKRKMKLNIAERRLKKIWIRKY